MFSESVAHWLRAGLWIQGSDVVVGSDIRVVTTFISSVHPYTVPAHSLHSLITSIHRPWAHVDGANARQKGRQPYFLKIKDKDVLKKFVTLI
jgi:hypothetical protein